MGDDFDDFNFGGAEQHIQATFHAEAADKKLTIAKGYNAITTVLTEQALGEVAEGTKELGSQAERTLLLKEAKNTNSQRPVILELGKELAEASPSTAPSTEFTQTHTVTVLDIKYMARQGITDSAVNSRKAQADEAEATIDESEAKADEAEATADKIIAKGDETEATSEVSVAVVTQTVLGDKLETVAAKLMFVELRAGGGAYLTDFKHADVDHHRAFDQGNVVKFTPDGNILGQNSVLEEMRKGPVIRINADGTETEIDKSLLREFTKEEYDDLIKLFNAYRVENPYIQGQLTRIVNKESQVATSEKPSSTAASSTTRSSVSVRNYHTEGKVISSSDENKASNERKNTFNKSDLEKLKDIVVTSQQIQQLRKSQRKKEEDKKVQDDMEINKRNIRYDIKEANIKYSLMTEMIRDQNVEQSQLFAELEHVLLLPLEKWVFDDAKKQEIQEALNRSGRADLLESLETTLLTCQEHQKANGEDSQAVEIYQVLATRLHVIIKELGPV